jgi:hypothetical protein
VLPDDDRRSKHVGALKCFNVWFRIIQYILAHLLVLIISESRKVIFLNNNRIKTVTVVLNTSAKKIEKRILQPSGR